MALVLTSYLVRKKWLFAGFLIIQALLWVKGGASKLLEVDSSVAEDVASDQDAYIAEDLDETLVVEHQEDSVRDVILYSVRRALTGGIPGLLAGALQVTLLMWLRTCINYQWCGLQFSNKKWRGLLIWKQKYNYGGKLREAMRALYQEGGIKRFYKGISFAIIQGPLSRFGGTAANAGVQLLVRHAEPSPPLYVAQLAGAVVAGGWRWFLGPIDTCKVVLQVRGTEGFVHLRQKNAYTAAQLHQQQQQARLPWLNGTFGHIFGSLNDQVVGEGRVGLLYQGAVAAALTTGVGHYPWFLTYNLLSRRVPRPRAFPLQLARNAGIGFTCSIVADLFSNPLRVAKASKQASAAEGKATYRGIYTAIYRESGLRGIFGRGLRSRILVNSIQNIFFTVAWRWIHEKMFPHHDDEHHQGERGVSSSSTGKSSSEPESSGSKKQQRSGRIIKF